MWFSISLKIVLFFQRPTSLADSEVYVVSHAELTAGPTALADTVEIFVDSRDGLTAWVTLLGDTNPSDASGVNVST